MTIRITIFGLLALFLSGPLRAEDDPPPPRLLAVTWLEEADGARVVRLALYHRDAKEPAVFHAGFGEDEADPSPGGYGTIEPDSWREIRVGPGELVLARRVIPGGGNAAVVIADRRFGKPLDIHEMIDDDVPFGLLFFEYAGAHAAAATDRHVVTIGGTVALTVRAPSDEGFFREETFELGRIARRLGVSSDDPDGPRGYVTVKWEPGDDPGAVELTGSDGAARIRSHFTNPKCPWAERHVGWMPDLYLLEYLRPVELRFTLDTSTVKAAGRITDLWKGYGAVSVESIWPNGFGGSSSNYDLDPVLVVPEGTAVREVDIL